MPSLERRRRIRAGLALATAVFMGGLEGCALVRQTAATAIGGEEPPPTGSPPLESLTDDQIEQRLAFLLERLDADRLHAAAWQYGWLAVNGGGMVASTAQAAVDTGDTRAYDITEATKGVIGTAYSLLAPMPGYRGAAPIRAMPARSREDRLARLARAEGVLRAAAARAGERTEWLPHLGNVALNVAGGAALLALGDSHDAALSFGVDTAVGEVQLWTQPWEPVHDWEAYRRLVATGHVMSDTPATTWHLVPTLHTLAIAVHF